MSSARSASAEAPSTASRPENHVELPGQNLTLTETLRVMDVAREMRNRRETAEEMFRQRDVRRDLREKLMRTARLAGDKVTETELDAAIDQYFARLHTYEAPKPGWNRFLAHLWIRRAQVLTTAAALTVATAGLWYFFF